MGTFIVDGNTIETPGFKRQTINEGVISADVMLDGSVDLICEDKILEERTRLNLDNQEIFEVAFSLLCLAQKPNDVDVVIDLIETNLDTEDKRKNTVRILRDILLYLGDE
jgi:hypothetical protein